MGLEDTATFELSESLLTMTCFNQFLSSRSGKSVRTCESPQRLSLRANPAFADKSAHLMMLSNSYIFESSCPLRAMASCESSLLKTVELSSHLRSLYPFFGETT